MFPHQKKRKRCRQIFSNGRLSSWRQMRTLLMSLLDGEPRTQFYNHNLVTALSHCQLQVTACGEPRTQFYNHSFLSLNCWASCHLVTKLSHCHSSIWSHVHSSTYNHTSCHLKLSPSQSSMGRQFYSHNLVGQSPNCHIVSVSSQLVHSPVVQKIEQKQIPQFMIYI